MRIRHKTIQSVIVIGLLAAVALAACGTPTPEPLLVTVEVLPTEVPSPPADTPLPEGVLSPKDLAAFDFVIEKKIETTPLAGLSLGIRWGDSPIYLKGYGYADLATSTPASEATVYQIASLTKQFTAAAIMQLAEQGLLALDDPVSRFFPQVPDTWQGITVRHLLNHTSGLPEVEDLASSDVPARLFYSSNVKELITGLQDVPLLFEPGSAFRYGGTGYRLLAGIIEQVTGLGSDAYFQENLFDPLGLDSTFACYGRYEETAQGYQIVDGQLEPILSYDPSRLVGPSGLCSTAADLLKWQQALAGGQVVSQKSYEEMISPTLLNDGTPVEYGYALGLSNDTVAHGGALFGFRSWLIHYPQDDLVLVVLSNTEVPDGAAVEILAKVIADRILGRSGE